MKAREDGAHARVLQVVGRGILLTADDTPVVMPDDGPASACFGSASVRATVRAAPLRRRNATNASRKKQKRPQAFAGERFEVSSINAVTIGRHGGSAFA
jgi:hypothetical protein